MKRFFKSLIYPLQTRLLDRHMCVACTRNLDKQKIREPLTMRTEVVICECNRAYIFDKERENYRRAIPAEVRSIPSFQ